MRRRSKKQEAGAGFSLFSYLDGLLCTMGALIIVLICISRGARFSHKTADGDHPAGPTVEEMTEELQNSEWRTKHMVEARAKTLQQLQDARAQLAHVEEHTGRLKKQFEELIAAEKALAEGGGRSATDERLRGDVDRLRKAVAAAQADLEAARQRAESRKPSYAIIPFQGPNSTRRRPIYVECTGERVILQPEGIELTPNDFAGPLGASNPLAAALRAEREYLYEQNDANQVQEEPYPLLLIRPDGIDAYCAAREAMQSWQSDFGYELIDQDWKLEYQPPNKELAEITQAVVNEARVRQQYLARQMPREATKEQWYRAGAHGVVRDGGVGGGTGGGPPGRSGRGGRGDLANKFAQRGNGGRSNRGGGGGGGGLGDGTGRSPGVGNGANGHGAGGDSVAGAYGSGGKGPGNGYGTGGEGPDGPNPYAGIADGIGGGGQTAGATGTGGAGALAGNATGRPGGATAGGVGGGTGGIGATGPGGPELVNQGMTGSGATGPGGAAAGGTANSVNGGNGDGTGTEPGGAAGGASGQSNGTAGSYARGGTNGTGGTGAAGGGGSPGGGPAGSTAAGQSGGAQSGSMAGSTTPGGSGSASSGGATPGGSMPNIQIGAPSESASIERGGVTNRPASPNATSNSGSGGSGSATQSLAAQNGKDWALPEESRHMVPIARPLVVECRSDKLIVHADGATSKVVKEIPMQGATVESVNELVGTVSEQAATWGPAGRGMYWKPSLSMQVAPGGEGRYADLQKLMSDSGLDVKTMPAPQKQVEKPKRWFGLFK